MHEPGGDILMVFEDLDDGFEIRADGLVIERREQRGDELHGRRILAICGIKAVLVLVGDGFSKQ